MVKEASSPERPITLNVQQTPWPLTAVWGDPDLLMLAFRNLLDNALKFSEPATGWKYAPRKTGAWRSWRSPTPAQASGR